MLDSTKGKLRTFGDLETMSGASSEISRYVCITFLIELDFKIMSWSVATLAQNSIYVFGRYEDDIQRIQRIDFDDQEEIESIEVIGYHAVPDVAALNEATYDFCTRN